LYVFGRFILENFLFYKKIFLNLMMRFFSILLFFPSISFGLLAAEIFPWAAFYSLIYTRLLNRHIVAIGVVLLLSTLFTLSDSFIDGGVNTDMLRSFAAYANVLLIFQCILYLSHRNILKLIYISKAVFLFLLGLGFLQLIGSDILGSFIKLIVPRGEGTALIDSGRGVTLFATEPARAGIELTLIYLIIRMTLLNGRSIHPMDMLIIVYQIVIIKSTSSVAFTMIAIAIMMLQYPKNYKIIVGFFLLSIFTLSVFSHGRASVLFSTLLEYENYKDALFFLINESGNRLIALYAFILSGFNHLLGHGVGNWQEASIIAVKESGFDYSSLRFFDVHSDGELSSFRGPGIISNLMLDIGLIGIIIVYYSFSRALKGIAKGTRVKKAVILIFLFKILLFGSPGNPIPLIMLALVLRYEDIKHHAADNRILSLNIKKLSKTRSY